MTRTGDWTSRLNLRQRLLVATLAPLVLVGAIGLGLGAYGLQALSQGQALERQAVQARVASAGLYGTLKGYLRLLHATSAELSVYYGDVERQQRVLLDRAHLLSVFGGGVSLLGSGGDVIAVTPPARASLDMNYAFRLYFRAVTGTGQPVLSSVFAEQPSGASAVVIAVPVEEPNGRLGVLTGQFLLHSNDWVREPFLLTPPPGGAISLIDSAGNLIYHSDPGRIGRSRVNETGLMQLVAAGKEAKLVYQTDPQAPGMLLGFAPIGDTGWYVVVEEPWDNIAGEVARYRWALAGLGGMAVLLVAGLLIGATRRVVRPLDALVTEGQRVLAGRKFRPLAVEGPADVRALLQVVNGMVARLAEQQATLRHYALQVLRGQEEERLRLSRDLHDETVQDLVALSQRLDLLRSRNQLDAEAAAELARFQAMLHSAIGEVRRLSNNLRPHVLEDLGLPAALRAIARDLETQLEGTQVHCEVVGRERALPSELELTVFRIAQEAFANIRKHASTATHVSVALIYEPDRVQLVVEDDGPGFQVGADSHLGDGHLGLTGMQERAQLFGGRLQVTSAPGQGTTVLLTLPQAGASPD